MGLACCGVVAEGQAIILFGGQIYIELPCPAGPITVLEMATCFHFTNPVQLDQRIHNSGKTTLLMIWMMLFAAWTSGKMTIAGAECRSEPWTVILVKKK